MNISTLSEVKEVLENAGYEVLEVTGAIAAKINGFVATITIDNEEVNVQCEVATLGSFEEEDLPMITYNALNANSRIRPFAFEIIDTRDDPQLSDPKNFILNLADSMPVGDLSPEELESTMQKLNLAINECKYVLKSVLGEFVA